MDQQDRYRTARALEYNRTGQSSTWVNPDNHTRYTVTPTRTYEGRRGPCRDFRTRAEINGERHEVTGRACRQPDGSWRVQD